MWSTYNEWNEWTWLKIQIELDSCWKGKIVKCQYQICPKFFTFPLKEAVFWSWLSMLKDLPHKILKVGKALYVSKAYMLLLRNRYLPKNCGQIQSKDN